MTTRRRHYPPSFLCRWPWYCLRPSARRRGRLEPQPRTLDLEPLDDPLRVVFFGDLMVTPDGRPPTVDPAVAEVVEGSDLVVGNCEAPVAERSSLRRFTFSMAEEFVKGALAALGARPADCILSVANNHAGDMGAEGPAETVRRLQALGVTTVGTPGLVVRDCGGVRLGLAAWTHWLNRSAAGLWRTRQARAQPWRQLRAEHALDCLVATPHWDFEFQHFPRPRTRDLAVHLLDEGVDLVVGHHPHVLQPLMRRNAGLCLFSTGNLNGLYFPWTSWPVRLGCLFEVRLVRAGPRRGRLAGYTLHPLVQEQRDGLTHIVPLEGASPPLRAKCESRLALLFRRR